MLKQTHGSLEISKDCVRTISSTFKMESRMADYTFEKNYWGNCTNTFDEEQKHFVYARCMGIPRGHHSFTPACDRILDVGGGPASMLLKVEKLKEGLVWDPIAYPQWTVDRYAAANISVRGLPGELLNAAGWDEVWMYNCLQHTDDPEKIVKNCLRAGKVFRIFEWLDIPPHEGHPTMLTESLLNGWLATKGTVRFLDGVNGCLGKSYSAVLTGLT
jgi:hypothetical protein